MTDTDKLSTSPIADLFALVCELSTKQGTKNIRNSPGLTVVKVDESWTVKINPHNEEIDKIPFGFMLAEYNKLPVGVFGMTGGSMVGDGEERLTEALNEAIRQLPEVGK